MFTIACCRCARNLDRPGALLFSPSDFPYSALSQVTKIRLCELCYRDLMRWMSSTVPLDQDSIDTERLGPPTPTPASEPTR
jgi:hypothetical protein